MNYEFKNKEDDFLLWQQFVLGDRTAFDAIIKMHYERLYSFGLKFSKDKEFLKDMVHDTFVALWKNRQLLQIDKNPKFYLFTIFRNLIFKEIRTLRNYEDVNLDILSVESVETFLIQKEDEAKIHTLIQKIPIRHQEALHLRFFEEMNYEQIATLMQINKQSVSNLIYSGLKMLKKLWVLIIFFHYFFKT